MKLSGISIIAGYLLGSIIINPSSSFAKTVLFAGLTHITAEHKLQQQAQGVSGETAPGFTTVDINGKVISLAQFKGKYVLLDFWASWCVPCRESNPHLIDLFHRYNSKGFDIIGIADDDIRLLLWRNAVKQDSTGIFHQILRGAAKAGSEKSNVSKKDLHQLYHIQSLPTKILIGPDGKIIARYGDNDTTDEDLDNTLSQLFK